MTGGEKCVVLAAALAVAVVAGVVTIGQPQDRKRENLGCGDDQSKEGLGFEAQLDLGFLGTPDHTKWHYGPPGNIPNNWSRHRGSYPRRQGETLSACGRIPMMHPAFPKEDRIWFYTPPADADEGI